MRAIGLALLAFVIVTQVRWHDEVQLTDGTVLRGNVKAQPDRSYSILLEDGDVRRLADAEIARRSEDVPHVTWGFRTLGGRVLEKPLTGVLVLVALVLVLLLTGVRWQWLLRAVDVPMRMAHAIRLTFVGGFFNLVLPGSTGGDVVKAYYAAKSTGRGTRSVLSVFVDRIIGVLTLVFVAAAALLYLDVTEQGRSGFDVARVTVYALLGGGVAAVAVLGSERLRKVLGLSAIIRRLPLQHIVAEVGASIRLYRGRTRVLVYALAVSFANQTAIALVVWALADALSIGGVTVLTCLALVPLMNLLAAIPLLPGGWGVGELAFAYFFGQVGVPATEAVGLSVLFRLSFVAANLPGGLLWVLMRGEDSREAMEAAVEQASERVDQVGVEAEPSTPSGGTPSA